MLTTDDVLQTASTTGWILRGDWRRWRTCAGRATRRARCTLCAMRATTVSLHAVWCWVCADDGTVYLDNADEVNELLVDELDKTVE
jgi:hypothetical protein